MMARRICMVAPDIFDGDAVGNHCLGVARAAARCGHEVLVFANASNVDSVRPIAIASGRCVASADIASAQRAACVA